MVVCVQREVAIRHSPVQTAREAVVSPETHTRETHTREEGKVMHASHHAYYSTHAQHMLKHRHNIIIGWTEILGCCFSLQGCMIHM